MENPHVRTELLKEGGVAPTLVDVRTRANLSGKDLANRLHWPASRVSKLEGGQQLPTADDVFLWMQACGAPSETARRTQAEVERIRQAYPHLERARRDSRRAGPTADALEAAFERGYLAAVNDMESRLADLLASGPRLASNERNTEGNDR